MDPSKRFPTIVLAAGVLVLLIAIAIGQQMGTRVLVQADNSGNMDATPIVTPLPTATAANYGPDWKRSQTLSAAGDPGFPDPRVPPKPLPTPEPTAKPTPKPKWTPNPNLPIWDQTALPSPTPSASTSPGMSASPSASVSPSASPGTKAEATPLPQP
ncbi:MAG: hypothetical protein KGM44_10185 [bacterium]|nr:hypothetical protein [bacterium]HET9029789.1 hypothetical protein [Candidatus Aquilonibacter sp.]